MKIFKFGGASVKNAEAVKNVADIIKMFPSDSLMIVVSAMGKTTNALEKIANTYYSKAVTGQSDFEELKNYHFGIIHELFPYQEHAVYDDALHLFGMLHKLLLTKPSSNFDAEYDRIIPFGELISSCIVYHYLNEAGVSTSLFDARTFIKTDSTFREGKIDWIKTKQATADILLPYFDQGKKTGLTQGFIASSPRNQNVTLGREGSDYTAAILAWCLDAEEVIIWKDVPGLLNADPKYFSKTRKLDHISYRDAIELAYFGASVIHPKTIQPLQNKNIPLKIKSFIHPDEEGSAIGSETDAASRSIPSYIFKPNQVLISISARDFSFIAEQNLKTIFGLFAMQGIRINMMQNSAISFSICTDNDARRINPCIEQLQKDFAVKFNENLELITIRYYTQEVIDRVVAGRKVLLEQRSRLTAQMVVKN
ncbi:MAG: aspartate kinase [Lentimicrobiaceae bacterium]|nr:aspartate kinase [Lentimicrobiaceae bacterium]